MRWVSRVGRTLSSRISFFAAVRASRVVIGETILLEKKWQNHPSRKKIFPIDLSPNNNDDFNSALEGKYAESFTCSVFFPLCSRLDGSHGRVTSLDRLMFPYTYCRACILLNPLTRYRKFHFESCAKVGSWEWLYHNQHWNQFLLTLHAAGCTRPGSLGQWIKS